jgi:hypothetical protein
MNTTKVFEGADIGVLLEQVHAEFGDRATVVGANRCRSGGFAGFFATESFEVIVEVPTTSATAATPRRSRLAARAAAKVAAAPTVPSSALSSARPTAKTGSSSPTLDALIEAADRAEREGTIVRTPPSTNVDPFAAVLQRASAEQSPVALERERPSERPSKRRIRRVRRVRRDDAAVTAPRPKGRRTRRGRDTQERVIDLAALERAGLMPSLNPLPVPSADGRDVLGPLRRGGDVSTQALLALGVPSALLSSADHGRVNLATVIGRLPVPPPMITGHGAMIAFVGEIAIVLDVARAVSVALHQDPDACVLLSPAPRPVGFTGEQISVIDDLSRRREEWSMLDRLTVVAIDVGFARQDVAWGRHAVSMLRPAMRWGVVAATRKADDIRSWSRGIGGLHALAVTGMAETTSPASVLNSGVPVARLDGQVATPELWMRLLSDRLAEQTTRRAPDLIAT